MNIKSMQKTINIIGDMINKKSPQILMGLGISGMISTTFLSVKATIPAVKKVIDEEKNEDRKLTKKEIFKMTWKYYVPAAISLTGSTACLVCSSIISSKRHAAIATAYSISENALREYQNKVIETIGEKKETQIKDEIHKDKVKENPIQANDVVITSLGNTLCYEELSGRYFYSDVSTIDKAVNELNRDMLTEGCISLNELYHSLGLKSTPLGEELGWNIGRGYIELRYSAQQATDGRPCLVIDYKTPPRSNFVAY